MFRVLSRKPDVYIDYIEGVNYYCSVDVIMIQRGIGADSSEFVPVGVSLIRQFVPGKGD